MKKKRNSTPKRKTANRQQRLVLATKWMKSFKGKNIMKGYAKWFGVDLLCAIAELRMLGRNISEEHEIKVRSSIANKVVQRKKAKARREQAKQHEEYLSPWDSEFEYIAGYTSNGVPYGIPKSDVDDEEDAFDVIFGQVIDNR